MTLLVSVSGLVQVEKRILGVSRREPNRDGELEAATEPLVDGTLIEVRIGLREGD